MPSPRGRMVALMASLAVVSLAGCSSGGGTNDDGAASAAGNATSGNAGAGASDDELGFLVRHAPGPLDDLVGDTLPQTAEEFVAQTRAVQERIAACMAAEGFEYVPYVQNADALVFGGPWEPGSPAYVAEYGFGLNEGPDDVAGGLHRDEDANVTEPEDANIAIRERMSEAELAAYTTALAGEVLAEWTDDFGTGQRHAGNGCEDSARLDADLSDSRTVEVIESAQEFLRSSIDSSVFDSLNAEWSACVREAGYVAADPEFLMRDLAGWDGEGFGGTPATPEEEMDAAVADLDCRRQTHYDTRYRDLNIAQQLDYIDHVPELQALLGEWSPPNGS